ncbi:TNF receptor-associated factor 6-like isoform X3 [Dermacentor variabilis]|uniref:TNF receptor-associated factor 6-like isoform X3 n=1 Tax=Dermacentor variabilis TaxID=34621 RepID=UPI003F5C8C59
MRVDVEYRGLPGGTHKLRFADELPRHVMCGTCGMLSMQMYEDEQRHAFCNVCVCLGSPAAAIFCKYENRNVPVDQLIEAFDIIQVIKDQVVYCPNEEKGCPVYTPLCRIEDHYLQCEKTEIECLQCQQRIKGCDWKSHSRDCPRKIVQCRFCVAAFPQIDLQMTSPTRDPVKIRRQGWPWFFLPAVYIFTCLAFFLRVTVNVCVKPILHIVFMASRFTWRIVFSLYRAALSGFGSSSNDSLQNAKARSVHDKSFY